MKPVLSLPGRIAMTVITTLLVIDQAAAFGTLEDQAEGSFVKAFKSLDRNHNSFLSREESAHDQDLADRFDLADSNHDGKLSDREYADTKSSLQQARVKSYLEDSTVTARVKAELLKDEGIRGLSISVETHRGQVILSGFVDKEEQIRRASEIASGVRGVISVKNSLILKG